MTNRQEHLLWTLLQTAGGTGAATGYKYDAFGNFTETDALLGRTTKSQYDGNGNRISDTDATDLRRRQQHKFGYRY